MLKILKEVEDNLFTLLEEKSSKDEVHTMFIDYHKPYVSRIWFQHGEYRVYLHMIHPCDDPSEAL